MTGIDGDVRRRIAVLCSPYLSVWIAFATALLPSRMVGLVADLDGNTPAHSGVTVVCKRLSVLVEV